MEKHIFEDQGILLIKGFVAKNVINRAKEAVFSELERLKIRTNSKWHTHQFDNMPTFQVTGKIAQKIHPQIAFDDVLADEVRLVANELANAKLKQSQPHPSILVTPPQKGQWIIPATGWHLDISDHPQSMAPGIQAFVLLDELLPRGGATVALAGTNRIQRRRHNSWTSLHQILQNDSNFKDLFDQKADNRERFFKINKVENVELRVLEMIGNPGDVYFMDMRVLHAPSLNTLKKARLMATNRYLRAD